MHHKVKQFPSGTEWRRLLAGTILDRVLDRAKRIETGKETLKGIEDFVFICRFDELVHEMCQRLDGVATSYVLMMFFYEQGIPDKRWYESPSKDGASIGYFPDFENHHFAIKAWFDFYSDTYYYKLFSAWDLMGHLINLRHALGLKKPDFPSALERLHKRDAHAARYWTNIIQAPEFVEARKIRNDIAHNSLPGTTGLRVDVSETVGKRGEKYSAYKFAPKPYVTSDAIVSNARQALKLFDESITAMNHVAA